MKLVVDSNIVFSAILSTQGRFAQLLIHGTRHFEFYTIGLLAEEIDRHKQKIMRISALDEETYQQTVRAILSKLTFVDDIALSDQELRTAMELTADIDEEDTCLWPSTTTSKHTFGQATGNSPMVCVTRDMTASSPQMRCTPSS